MDESRKRDLIRLQAVIDNPNKPRHARRSADRTKRVIVQQLRDRRLVHLREQLVKAAKKYDEGNELKIANTIKNYLKQEQIEV